jgi:hypothetical protein
MMLSDAAPNGVSIVQQLNRSGIPVAGIPFLPFDEGYYFTADDAPQSEARYEEWKVWTQLHGLLCDGVGLDIEPDVRLTSRS